MKIDEKKKEGKKFLQKEMFCCDMGILSTHFEGFLSIMNKNSTYFVVNFGEKISYNF
jgi:hypothetical protein